MSCFMSFVCKVDKSITSRTGQIITSLAELSSFPRPIPTNKDSITSIGCILRIFQGP